MSSMNFFNVEKKINKLKKELHFSFDVTSRVIKKKEVTVGFIYLKSFTDNLIFSTAIYQPIAESEEIDFQKLKTLVQANDVKEIEEKEIIGNILKGGVVIFLNNSSKILSMARVVRPYPSARSGT